MNISKRNKRIKAFQDTMQKAMSPALQKRTEQAAASSAVYFEGFQTPKIKKPVQAEIIVENNTTFAAAGKYLPFGKTAVLNFANPVVPGGGVKNGAIAQEECLCLSSNLYACLTTAKVFPDYYQYHKHLRGKFYSDRLIYTEGVTVFKDDEDIPKPLEKKEWFQVDVITCAAPYVAGRIFINKTALKELFEKRIQNIFEAAIAHNVDVIILGAFGCGAFKNPPEVVARAFRETIKKNGYRTQFRKIVFAIKSTGGQNMQPDYKLGVFQKELLWPPGDKIELQLCNTFVSPTIARGFIAPSGKLLADDRNFNQYRLWNKYFGKQFSILGDSISTLEGYNPEGYSVFYGNQNCQGYDAVYKPNTWWSKVIDFFGGELLVNNSWSGSMVTKPPNQAQIFPSACSDERTSALHINNVEPDVILIYIGTNDWASGAKITDSAPDAQVDESKRFDLSYDIMLQKLKKNYPNSEIWCCTLCQTSMAPHFGFEFPHSYGGTHIKKYNEIIQNAAWKNRCNCIDLYGYNLPYDTIDGTHPTVDGMQTLATMMIRSIGGKDVDPFMDCPNENHTFIVAGQTDENTTYVCKKCAKIKHIKKLLNKDTASETGFISNNSEYVLLGKGQSALFPSNTLRLTREEKTLEYKKYVVKVGRNSSNDLNYGNKKYISRQHATFFYERNMWFLQDNSSINGTYINGIRIQPNKKYQLAENDRIEFSELEKVIFFKREQPMGSQSELDAIAVDYLQRVIAAYAKVVHNKDQTSEGMTSHLKMEPYQAELYFRNILAALHAAPLFLPIEPDEKAMFVSVNPAELTRGMLIKPKNNVKMRIITLRLKDGREIVPIFTSREESKKKLQTSMIRYYAQDYLPMLIRMEKPVVINPFSESCFLMSQNLMRTVLMTFQGSPNA